MPILMNDNNGIQMPSAALPWDRAAHVRRLMAALVFEADKQVLREYAEELEEQATEKERADVRVERPSLFEPGARLIRAGDRARTTTATGLGAPVELPR